VEGSTKAFEPKKREESAKKMVVIKRFARKIWQRRGATARNPLRRETPLKMRKLWIIVAGMIEMHEKLKVLRGH